MRSFYRLSGILLAVTILVSCTRKNDIIDPTPLPPGGMGGKATLNVTPQHHKKSINDATIYIWYARTTQPDDLTSFDDSMDVTTSIGRPAATFVTLTQGDYYLYAKGKDFDLEPGNDEIMGGAHYRIVDTLERTYDLYLQMDNSSHHE